MKAETFKKLQTGDIIKHATDKRPFIVTANYGDRVTAVAVVDMTNPSEWQLVLKASFTDPNP